MSRTAAELLIARVAAADYRERARILEREALLLEVGRRPLSARICKQYAFIARNAARAEEWTEGLPQ